MTPFDFSSAPSIRPIRQITDRFYRTMDAAWDQALREFFDRTECGLPTAVTLRNHGCWIIPAASKRMGHQLFSWRGQIVLEGWMDRTESGYQYVIHPHSSHETPC